MRILSGPGNNSKLGPLVYSWSRPVGPTCPAECPFLSGVLPGGGTIEAECYADRLQQMVVSVRDAWEANESRPYWGGWAQDLRRDLEEAGDETAVRIHVGGDLLDRSGEIERPYLAAILWAFRDADPRPRAWIFTHAWEKLGSRGRRSLERVGIEVFASVHCPEDGWKARSMGFRLAIDGGEMPAGGGPAWVALACGGIPALACPEQRLGADRITCSSCEYCFRRQRHHGDVIFYRHGPGTVMGKTGGRHVE